MVSHHDTIERVKDKLSAEFEAQRYRGMSPEQVAAAKEAIERFAIELRAAQKGN
jgi:hypothetical protein